MKNTDREEALELPDREAMTVLSTTRVIPVDGYGPLPGDPRLAGHAHSLRLSSIRRNRLHASASFPAVIVGRREMLRAHVTRRTGHGQRYVVTRLYLSDGTIEQQVNPGHPDGDELPWTRVGTYADLATERTALTREGWAVEAPRD